MTTPQDAASMSKPTPPTPPSLTSAPLHLGNSLGALVIAEILVAVLYGIASVQVYVYLHRSPREIPLMKRAILLLWILDSLYLAFMSHTVYHYAVTSFMNPLALAWATWSLAPGMIIGSLIEVIGTLAFAYKIYKLRSVLWLFILIMLPQFIGSAGAFAIGILVRKVPSFQELAQHFAWTWYSLYSFQALSDCTISIALCTILIKSRTGFKRTDSLILSFMLYSICTCALTSFVSIATIVAYAAMPDNLVFIAITMVLPLLMSNSLLGLLNSRDLLREKYAGQAVSIHLSRLAGVLGHSGPSNGTRTEQADSAGTNSEDDVDTSCRIPDTLFAS
ncbi:uncharacterized protein PHACADRAFT_210811 [Phanerochaete carnosa HHB-10118-sp]|uniref:DUF6534 domain-containing protein n=1 Tax=Phanerochaete carnosa (strain HHB-10118-sp) TaxID=650164 RepID=K5VNN6_PHACS|nr:uncharacterized protein PHACADRAFT_210811 [Phanerochaete carnosa HHB-10118-sp]EKM53093.1 hypothetical protein PHACADRAFT_210811 [Phanerochaete carnosa HHB-10118-sp]